MTYFMHNTSQKKNYRNALKSTTLIGGGSFISIILQTIKTKFIAIWIGPSGVGLIDLYQSILQIASTLSDLGINTSGVREVASNIDDVENESRVVSALRGLLLFSGFIGMAAIAIGAPIWSRLVFQDSSHTGSIVLLSIIVLMGNIAVGQSCVIQGHRHIADLAKKNIFGSLCGLLISIPCYYYLEMRGVVPALILMSAANLAVTYYYARKIPIKRVRFSFSWAIAPIQRMLKLGIPIMLLSFIYAAFNMVTKPILLTRFSLDGVGKYMAAVMLSGVLVRFVLSAMSADFYPRLVEIAKDKERIRDEMDIQSEIAILLAAPLLLATIIFAPLIISIFYSSAFTESVDILRMTIFGSLGYVVSWPLAYFLLSQGMGKTDLFANIIAVTIHLLVINFASDAFGLVGAGLASPVQMFSLTIIFLIIYHRKTGYLWSFSYLIHLLLLVILMESVILVGYWNVDLWIRWVIYLTILSTVSIYSMTRLMKKSGLSILTALKRFSGKNE